MDRLMACRICLATDVKLYEMCKYRLKTAYDNLSGLNICSTSYQQYVCSYCGTMLINYTKFREKCIRSQQVLEKLKKEHVWITTNHVETINRCLHNLTLPYTTQHMQNFDFGDISQSFHPNFFSIITVKDENCHVKPENDEYYKHNYDYNNDVDIKNDFHVDDDANVEINDEQLWDSDEEPLAKKVKKKRKKYKVKDKRSVTLRKYEVVDVKTEDCQIFSTNTQSILMDHQDLATNDHNLLTNDHNLLTNDQNLPTNDQNLPTNDQILPTNDQNLPTNDQNLPTNDQNLPTNDQNLPTNDQNLPTNDQNLPTNQNPANQVLDLEIDHKLVILSTQEQIEEVLTRKTSSNYLNSVYKCDYCYKGFMTEATHRNHMARHDPCSGEAACPACATRWPDARALRAHTLISHERRYICKLCGHVSKSSHKAKEHTQWHAGVTFPCNICGRTFTKSTSCLTHVRLRHATHACASCGQSFIGENGLSMHMKKAHRDNKAESVHECLRCRVHFRSTAALRRHCDLSGGACDDTLRACAQCGDHLASDQLLKEHTDAHLKTDALRTCTQCSRTFANERSLAAHVQRTHSRTHARAPRHCVCEVCGYKCMSASSLVNHQRVHSGEKPHACTRCHKTFSVAQRLQIHMRTHTGERPFQCARCPKAFKHKAALNRHDRVHTGAKPYSCPQCGKSFSQSNSMKQHCAGVHMKTLLYCRRTKHT